MYTEMHSTYLSETYVQRCNFMWWTVYVLERRLSSLMGVPMGIAEESISTPFPSTYRYQQGSNVMEMQVKLCQVLAKIDQSEPSPITFSKALSLIYDQLYMASKANSIVAILVPHSPFFGVLQKSPRN